MNHQQLLKHIVRVFPNWYVGMYISWVRPLWLSALQFQVYLKDALGEPCHLTSDVNIVAHLTSLVDGSTTNATLESYTPAISTLSYKPTQRGRHHLTVSVNGEEIANSPYSRYVQYPPAQLGHRVRTIEGLNDPCGVVVTSNECLVVTENDYMSVRDLHGKLIKRIGPLEVGLQRVDIKPNGVAVGNDGVMFVTDFSSNRLLKLSCDGTLLKAAGGRGEDPGQFLNPHGITLISNKLFVCDSNNHRVQVFDTDLNFLDSFGTRGSGEGEFSRPLDISTDRDGCLYVADYVNGRVQVFSQSGSFLRYFGKYGSGPGELSGPCGIHVHNEHVYITERLSCHVSVFTTTGEFASSFTVGQSGCGWGITTDRDGFMCVIPPRAVFAYTSLYCSLTVSLVSDVSFGSRSFHPFYTILT